MLIDKVKIGDVLRTKHTVAYLDKLHTEYTVTRITKTTIWCNTTKIDKYGSVLPRDKYDNHYVSHVNGVPIKELT